MKELWLDLETFSATADLKETGAHRYVEMGCEIQLFGWAIDDAPARVWQPEYEDIPAELAFALHNADFIYAHNAAFDRTVLEAKGLTLRADLPRWRCTMAMAHTLSLPPGLGALCRAVGLSEDEGKVKDGNRLVMKFMRPRKPSKNNPDTAWTRDNSPEDWARYVEYCRMDVEAMRTCSRRLSWCNFEPRVWRMDQDMNDRGFAVDIALCRSAITISEMEYSRLYSQMNAASGGRVPKPTMVGRIREWLASQRFRLPNLTRDTIEASLARPGVPDAVRQVLTARLEYSRATVSKYTTLLAGTSRDGRARGNAQYSGAGQTMRWAGRRFQYQNLIRPVVNCHNAAQSLLDARGDLTALNLMWHPTPPLDVVASAVRGLMVAPKDKVLHVWDLSQIEARICAWYAGAQHMLDAFADAERDPYVEAAKSVGSDSRQLGKALVLACGFGMGPAVFRETAAKAPYFIEMDDDTAKRNVYDWRSENPQIGLLWNDMERMAKNAIRAERRLKHTPTGLVFAYETFHNRKALTIKLPSGHRLVYWDAVVTCDRIHYSRYVGNGVAPDYGIWGGTFVENIVQMTARHIMAACLLHTDEFLDVVATIHDEGIAEGDESTAQEDSARMGAVFHRVPSWAKGLPLAAEGRICRRYDK